jgi:hypothetical protein
MHRRSWTSSRPRLLLLQLLHLLHFARWHGSTIGPAYDGAVTVNAPALLPSPDLSASQRTPAERVARAMAAVDGSAWEPLLPQALAALGEVWRMMDRLPVIAFACARPAAKFGVGMPAAAIPFY